MDEVDVMVSGVGRNITYGGDCSSPDGFRKEQLRFSATWLCHAAAASTIGALRKRPPSSTLGVRPWLNRSYFLEY